LVFGNQSRARGGAARVLRRTPVAPQPAWAASSESSGLSILAQTPIGFRPSVTCALRRSARPAQDAGCAATGMNGKDAGCAATGMNGKL